MDDDLGQHRRNERDLIKKWLLSMPGLFEGTADSEVLSDAHEAFAMDTGYEDMTDEDFRRHLHVCGYRPEWRSDGWIVLALPELSPGVRPA